jgi:hypothetical protein
MRLLIALSQVYVAFTAPSICVHSVASRVVLTSPAAIVFVVEWSAITTPALAKASEMCEDEIASPLAMSPTTVKATCTVVPSTSSTVVTRTWFVVTLSRIAILLLKLLMKLVYEDALVSVPIVAIPTSKVMAVVADATLR